MNLKKFPMDSQMCPLYIGSYGYPAEDLIYVWKANPISFAELVMAQFRLDAWTSKAVETNATKRMTEKGYRSDSLAYLHFFFERQMGFFLLQFYAPLFLIVMCSWVGFWIVKSDVPGRAGLGVTTVLSVAKLGFVGGSKAQVPYATALDVYVIICFFSVFASMIEFAVINFLTVFIAAYKKTEAEEKEKASKKEDVGPSPAAAASALETMMLQLKDKEEKMIRFQSELRRRKGSSSCECFFIYTFLVASLFFALVRSKL